MDADGERFSYALAADGLNSPIRKSRFGSSSQTSEKIRMRRHYAQKPWCLCRGTGVHMPKPM